MSAHRGSETIESHAEEPCVRCPLRRQGICNALIGEPPKAERMALRKEGRIGVKRQLHQPGEQVSTIKMLRKGWLAGILSKSGDKRLIARILMPGDMVGGGVLLQGRPFYTMEALTDVDYCSFPVSSFAKMAETDPDFLKALTLYSAEAYRTHQNRIFEIGSREAEERILSLVLELYDRAHKRGHARDGTMFFPLRQYHLADATGMTPVHVNRTLKRLRDLDLLHHERQTISMPDVAKVRRRLG